jgi:Domain of unknown function (DUF6468)
MTNGFGLIINFLVAILLMLTIGYCMLLNRRLKLLKADEHSLRATISELVTATEIAERAIAGLKLTVHECDAGLGERLRRAERVNVSLDRSLAAGREVIERVSKIALAARAQPEPKASVSGAQSVAVAAQAFAEKLRVKVNGLAA